VSSFSAQSDQLATPFESLSQAFLVVESTSSHQSKLATLQGQEVVHMISSLAMMVASASATYSLPRTSIGANEDTPSAYV